MVAEWKLENDNGGYTYLDAVAAAVSFFLLLLWVGGCVKYSGEV
jgi:hypothetical protein